MERETIPGFKKRMKKTSLEIRLKVSNQMAFISLLTELGFREDKPWGPDEDTLLQKLCDSAKRHTVDQLETIAKWEKDGRPE